MSRHPNSELKEKEFVARDSLLTELWELKHIQAIQNMFVAFLIVLFLNDAISHYVATGKFNLDFDISWIFEKFYLVVAIWVCMFISTLLLVYPGFVLWSKHRNDKSMCDYIWLSLYICYLSLFVYLPVKVILHYDMPPVSSFAILCEQVRFLMKIHAFVRSCVPSVLEKNHTNDSEKETKLCPDFSKFLYFSFAPTLVYKDNYPRNSTIRWRYVMSCFAQVIGCLFYIYFIVMRFSYPLFKRFGQEPMKPTIFYISKSMLPAMFYFLCGFFCSHSWLNAFAEMLRFSDRMFYQDWWNARTLAEFFRKWNLVVHDWLYMYIYKDAAKFFPSNNLTKLLVVFTVSAIVHEFILIFSLRFFFPLLYILFGVIGVGYMVLTKNSKWKNWNLFFWVMLFFKFGILFSLYSMEWFARINCPPYYHDAYMDYVVARSWVCSPMTVSRVNFSRIHNEL